MQISPYLLFFLGFFLVGLCFYTVVYIRLSRRVKSLERGLLDVFLKKASKIPALIEVMRPYVAKKEAFESIIRVHTEIMIEDFPSVYDILSHNARIQNDFLFLMELSMQIAKIQKDEYFLYIRDFIIEYERHMKRDLAQINEAIFSWNRFVKIKNMTGIGYFFPGREMDGVIS